MSIVARLQPCADTDPGATLCLFIANRDNIGDAVLACFSSDNPNAGTLIPVSGSSINLGINLPCGIQDFTLTYNTQTERATLMRQNGGVSVIREIAFGINDPAAVVVGLVTDGAAVVRKFIATGPDIPEFPGVLNKDNPWVDFSQMSSGRGSEIFPFKFLSGALAVANPGATVSIVPGTNSTEKPTIMQNVILANSDFASGSVSIGVSARRDADLSTEGFVSRGSSVRRSVRRR